LKAAKAATPAKLAVVAGSGMGALADQATVDRRVPFADIDGVGACTVAGHAGEVREGTLDGRSCVWVLGRRHGYERQSAAMLRLVDWLAARGVTHLLVTAAAGALRQSLLPGEIVVARDVIDRQNRRWSQAPRADRPEARLALDPGLVAALECAATRAGVAWHRGTLVCGSGPAYETAAEVRYLQESAGDVATMSAAPEVIAANRIGLPVAIAALVTNPGTGIAPSVLSHTEVLDVGQRSVGQVGAIVRQLLVEL
jgi:inosine/guanosine/xanthosine phosphorylase family protein